MPTPEAASIDPWSYFDFKPGFTQRIRSDGTPVTPIKTWVGEHHRRLQAYILLESYYRNSSRDWLLDIDEDERSRRREYGDPKTIVDQVLASVIGDDQSIVVPDAEGDSPDSAAVEQLDVLLDWATREKFIQRVIENERNSIKLGDGVYVLSWSEKLQRPRLRVWDPGFYFPVLDPEDLDADFPRTIHLAYEYEVEDSRAPNGKRKYVRRMTWEIGDIPEEEADRMYAWSDDPTRETVYFSDARWIVGDVKSGVEDFPWSKAEFMLGEDGEPLDHVDLQQDFIPVVHVPNSIAGEEHFGVSTLASVLQVFDDLVATDTDLQGASATTGTPPIALSGTSAPKDSEGNTRSYGPGTVWETGDGSATVLDTSRSLDALLKYGGALLERLAVNSRVPESLLGRVKPNEVPSGIALTLSFSPHSAMVKEMRLVRDEKYGLLLKMVSRYFFANGDIADAFPANVKFGSFLPADRQETMTIVSQLYAAHIISLEVGIRMMVDAGFPIEDAAAELARIRSQDFEGASALLDATGDINAVRIRLGLAPIEEVAPPPPPPVTEPPAPTPEPEES